MSHEPARRQQRPAAAPRGLQLPASLQRPPRPGARPRPGPRASRPPARPAPAASSRRRVLAPRLGGCCTQRWVWPRCPLHCLACGALQRKRKDARVRALLTRPELGLSAPPCPPASSPHSQTLLSPLHFWKFIGVAFTKKKTTKQNSFGGCRSHWKGPSGCWAPLCNLAEGSPADGECNEGASCFWGGGACLGMRKGVLIIVGMCCFLKSPSGFIPCCWTKSGEEKLWRYKPLVCNFSKCACHYREQFR